MFLLKKCCMALKHRNGTKIYIQVNNEFQDSVSFMYLSIIYIGQIYPNNFFGNRWQSMSVGADKWSTLDPNSH